MNSGIAHTEAAMTTTDQRPRGPWRALLTLGAVLAGAFVALVLAGALAQPASASGGLTGYCYNGKDFNTPVGESRTDATLNVDFTTNGATCGSATTDPDSFSVLWSGTLTTGSSTSIKLRLTSNDGRRLSFNGTSIFSSSWTTDAGAATETSSAITVAANTTYPIIVGLRENTGVSSINLQWDPTGGTNFITIPTANLTPPASPIVNTNTFSESSFRYYSWFENPVHPNWGTSQSYLNDCAASEGGIGGGNPDPWYNDRPPLRVTFLVSHSPTAKVTGLLGDTQLDGTIDDDIDVPSTGLTVESADRAANAASPNFNYSLVSYAWRPPNKSISSRGDFGSGWLVKFSDGSVSQAVSGWVHLVDCGNNSGPEDYGYIISSYAQNAEEWPWRYGMYSNTGCTAGYTNSGFLPWSGTCYTVAVAPGGTVPNLIFQVDEPDTGSGVTAVKYRIRRLSDHVVVSTSGDIGATDGNDVILSGIVMQNSWGRGRYVIEVQVKEASYADPVWWHLQTVDVNGSATPSISIGNPTNTTDGALGSTIFQGDNFEVVATTSDVGVNDQTGAVQMIEWDRDNNNTTSGTGGADGYEDRRLSQPDMGASPAITTADRTATNSVSTNIGTCPTGGTYTVRARATDNGALNGADNDRKSSTASKAVTIRCRPNLQITSSHTGNFSVGMPGGGTYTIGVQNLTGASVGSTQGDTVTVTDTLPTGLVPTAWSGSGWSCGISVQTVTCTSTTALAPGASANNISVTVRPEPVALGSQPHAPKVKVAGDTEKQVTDSTIVGHSIKGDMLAQVQPLQGSVKKYTVHFELQSFPSGSVKDYYLVQIKDKDTQTVLYSNTQSPTAGTLWNSPASLSANYNFSGTPKVRGVTTGQFTLTGNNSGTSTVRFDVLPVFTNSFTGRIQIKDPNGNPVLPDPPSGTLPYWVYPTFNPTTMEFRSPTIP